MKKAGLFFIVLLLKAAVFCQSNPLVTIIPEPVKLTQNAGYFTLPGNIIIQTVKTTELTHVVTQLQERLSVPTSYKVSPAENGASPTIKLELNKTADPMLGNEGYNLSVTSANVVIKANNPAGIFYGIQTLLQLLPKEIVSQEKVSNVEWKAPCVEITDYPRFGWRGLMLDVSRHFFTKEEVKAYIDQMSKYKFNLFHWHLTDDEGWRIEIKSLPKLNDVGAWRVYRIGRFGTFAPPADDEPRTYGGFYTQDDIKEVIQYAKERFVNVLPEIDVPGHSMAAVASYPELSCTPGAENYRPISGENFMDWSQGHPPIALKDNTLCPANEKVYAFLDKVMTEVAALFPFDYIHVGGDECPKNYWQKSEAVTALMKKENLKDYMEVQSYFEKRLEKIVESKGKKFMGWDEILQGGLAPNAAVMSWRGMDGGIAAAKMKHEVVMSPTDYVYLDYMQSDSIMEPVIYASLRLNKTYKFEPVPEGVDAKYIKGGQGNLWTEQVYTFRQAEYMTWPRAFAISETTWSPKEKKNWDNFVNRVEEQFARFNIEEVKYAPSMYDPDFIVTKADNILKVELKNEVNGLDIYYSLIILTRTGFILNTQRH